MRRENARLYLRHCERSEAIHGAAKKVRVDCFAALAMTWIGRSVLAAFARNDGERCAVTTL
jgi:hypothetical protein